VADIDDRRVVAIGEEARIEPRGGRREVREKILELDPRHQRIIGRNAGLAGIEQFAAHDALDRHAQIGALVHDRRRLAAELERHGREVLCRRLQHLLADRGRAGIEDVIEGEPGEEFRDLGAALGDGDHVGGQPLGEDVRDQGRRPRRRLGGLDDHPVARGERRRERTDRQIQGIVPGGDDQRDTLGLPEDLAAGAEKDGAGAAALATHPGPDAARGIADQGERG